MISSSNNIKIKTPGTWAQLAALMIITILFWIGIIIWLRDGAWENGELPTHGIYHMIVGFLGCWISFLTLFFLRRKLNS